MKAFVSYWFASKPNPRGLSEKVDPLNFASFLVGAKQKSSTSAQKARLGTKFEGLVHKSLPPQRVTNAMIDYKHPKQSLGDFLRSSDRGKSCLHSVDRPPDAHPPADQLGIQRDTPVRSCVHGYGLLGRWGSQPGLNQGCRFIEFMRLNPTWSKN